MSPQQITLLRQSLAPLTAHAARTGALFYAYLFTFDRSLRPLFPANLEGEGEKLVQTLSALVNALDHHDEALISGFARRHAVYFEPSCCNVLREALLWTFAQLLGDEFHDDVAAAWCRAYNMVARVARAQQAQWAILPANA